MFNKRQSVCWALLICIIKKNIKNNIVKKILNILKNIIKIRKRKYWGLSGNQNGMYGMIGKKNPNWNGGHSSERQAKYAQYFWKELRKSILRRDNYKCRKCKISHNSKNKLIVHHIKFWSKSPELRFEPNNLITLCEKCHKNIHKKEIKQGGL